MNPFVSLLAYGGLAALALAMKRHHRTATGRDLAPSRRRRLRTAGWILLIFSLLTACRIHGPEIGSVAWFAVVAAAGFTLTFLLAYAPRLWPIPLAGLLLLACFV
jgi:hypothetical protein